MQRLALGEDELLVARRLLHEKAGDTKRPFSGAIRYDDKANAPC